MDLRRISRQVMRYEKVLTNSLLCLLLTVMILFACLQIGLRTFFSSGLLWIDPLLRHLVLWCGLLGAVTATRKRKHISIDVIGYLTPEKVRLWIDAVIDAFATLVTAGITCAAIIFVRNEFAFPGSPLIGLPSWFWALIFPLAFGLMAVHFLAATVADIRTLTATLSESGKAGSSL